MAHKSPAPDDEECSQPSSSLVSKRTSTRSRDPRNKDSWPVHPIPALRGPFDESIAEAMDPDVRIRRTLDAAARRLQLLELDEFPEDYSSRWRHKPGSKFHPLWKLIAQISFGIHLLHQHTAKSEEEVIRILQTHIDEVDGFLEDTHADFDLAVRDIDERSRLLQLSLDHGRTFGRMLRNADFRSNILHGNDVIEKIIHRTSKALKTSMEDVRRGVDATAEFAKYLDRVKREWTLNNEDMEGVYEAMRGNAEGWYCCFNDLEEKAKKLKALMARLGALVSEVARRAGIASRKVMRDLQKRSRSQDSSATKAPSTMQAPESPSRKSLRMSMSKPLPPNPRNRIPGSEEAQHSPDIRFQQPFPGHGLGLSSTGLYSPTSSRRPSQQAGSRRVSQSTTSRRPSDHGAPNLLSTEHLDPRQTAAWSSLQNTPSMHRLASSPGTQTLTSPAMSTPPVISSLTPDKLLQLLETHQGQANGLKMNGKASQTLHLTPLASPITPEQLAQAVEESKQEDDSQRGRRSQGASSFSTSVGPPFTPGQLLQAIGDAHAQQSPQRPEESPAARPMTSPISTEMQLPFVSHAEDIPIRFEDIAGDRPLASPPPTQMLIPVMTDEGEMMQLGEIIFDGPPLASMQNGDVLLASPTMISPIERVSPVISTPDSEEKQVMSRETFLMLDDVNEMDEESDQVSPKHTPLDLVAEVNEDQEPAVKPPPLEELPELEERRTEEDGYALSRRSTQKSTKSTKSRASSGRRSRPHSSYSVIEAWRKSKQLSGGVALPSSADQEDHPPVPSIPDLPFEIGPSTDLIPAMKPRKSTDSTAPPLTKSGSTTSLESAQNDERSALAIHIDNDTGERPMSPQGPAIIDDGMLELIRPSANIRPSLRYSRVEGPSRARARSIDLIMRSPAATSETFPDFLKSPRLLRSNSSRSYYRDSKFSMGSAYSKQASPNIVMPNSSFIPSIASFSPYSIASKAPTPLVSHSKALTPALARVMTPSTGRPDSWISEKVVVVSPPPEDDESTKHEKAAEQRPAGSREGSPSPQARKPITRKPVPMQFLAADSGPVEADSGAPRSQPMITTFTPLSPASPRSPRSPRSYRLMPKVPPSPSALSTLSTQALPMWPPTDAKPKKLGTLKKPVNAVRGLFKKQQQH